VIMSEITTLKCIDNRIPVPEVFDYEQRNNVIGTPYMFMEMVEGNRMELHVKKNKGGFSGVKLNVFSNKWLG
jgi:aminoglycoside phosphotransferase (APT) family kinase protein